MQEFQTLTLSKAKSSLVLERRTMHTLIGSAQIEGSNESPKGDEFCAKIYREAELPELPELTNSTSGSISLT